MATKFVQVFSMSPWWIRHSVLKSKIKSKKKIKPTKFLKIAIYTKKLQNYISEIEKSLKITNKF